MYKINNVHLDVYSEYEYSKNTLCITRAACGKILNYIPKKFYEENKRYYEYD